MADGAEVEPRTPRAGPRTPGTGPGSAGGGSAAGGSGTGTPETGTSGTGPNTSGTGPSGTGPSTSGTGPNTSGAGPNGRRAIRAGRNLPVAAVVGAVLGALVVLSLFTVKVTFLIYMGAAIFLAGWELSRALGSNGIRLPRIPLAVGGAAMWASGYWLGPRAALATFGLAAVAVLFWRLPGGADGYVRDVTGSIFALAYLPLLATFAVLMLASQQGAQRVLLFIVLTICNDMGGYFAGILVGRHQLVPRISPKKTWEGLAGSALVCIGAGMGLLPVLLHGQLWQGAILGAAAVAASTLGDLVESMIKRDVDIKDMGSVLPGHGGILDRLDSLLANAPVIWLLLALFLPAGAR